MKSFSEFSLSAPLKSNLVKHGFTEPTPVQALAIEPALAGRDLVATAQTGTGKTLAFVLPIIHLIAKQAAAFRRPRRHPEPHARTGHPNRRDLRQNGGGHRRSRRRRGRRAQRAPAVAGHSQGRAGADRHARQAVRFPQPASSSISAASACWFWTKPTGCWTWASCPPSKASWPPCPPTARRCSSRRRSKARSNTWWRRTSATPCASKSAPPPSPSSRWNCTFTKWSRTASWGCWKACCAQEEGSFLVFARTKHGADRLAKKLARGGVKTAAIHGDRSQNQRNQALRGLPGGLVPRAGGHRRRGPRDPRGRDLARGELRSAASSGGLHPPRGPHGARGRARHGLDLRDALRARRHRAHRANDRDAAGARGRFVRRSPRGEADGCAGDRHPHVFASSAAARQVLRPARPRPPRRVVQYQRPRATADNCLARSRQSTPSIH